MQYQAETLYIYVMAFHQYMRIGQFVLALALFAKRYYQFASVDCNQSHSGLRGLGPKGAQAGRGGGHCASVLKDGPSVVFVKEYLHNCFKLCSVCCSLFGCADNAFHDWTIQFAFHFGCAGNSIAFAIMLDMLCIRCKNRLWDVGRDSRSAFFVHELLYYTLETCVVKSCIDY